MCKPSLVSQQWPTSIVQQWITGIWDSTFGFASAHGSRSKGEMCAYWTLSPPTHRKLGSSPACCTPSSLVRLACSLYLATLHSVRNTTTRALGKIALNPGITLIVIAHIPVGLKASPSYTGAARLETITANLNLHLFVFGNTRSSYE
jgi:hypothetical protein